MPKTLSPTEAAEPASLKKTGARPLGDMHVVQRELNVCRTVVENLLRTDPEFPAPISIANKRQWFMDEIEDYKASRPRRVYTAVVVVVAAVGIAAHFLFAPLWA